MASIPAASISPWPLLNSGISCLHLSVDRCARIGNEISFEVHPYGFGERRFPLLALLTLITLSEWRSCGVVITKFSGHVVTLRSSPTVFADTPISWSTSTRIVAGKPPRAIWSAAMLLGLYRIWAPSWGYPTVDCKPHLDQSGSRSYGSIGR